jgi:rifampicin phosphotransferase
MSRYVLNFQEIEADQVADVGGKGVALAELSRIEGVSVPVGFCVTTGAFRRCLADASSVDGLLDQLAGLEHPDREAIRTLSAELRRTMLAITLPDEVTTQIRRSLAVLGEQGAYAVRSSATAEDLPTASFAGQQDSYLNIVGPAGILERVSGCWASLFTERAVTYRLHNGFDHRKVEMAVIVQQMVDAQAAGIMFTADPVSSNRKVISVEAGVGLGEALVSGLVEADLFKVRDRQVVARALATKKLAIRTMPGGGTGKEPIEPEAQDRPALTDAQAVRLAQLGRKIEAHFQRPQDIEWCLADDQFQIVQSRPITTLFPIPAAGDQENRVYLSVGHQQMMTDAMKPLGLSFWQLTTPRPMAEAGGRLFVDVTRLLASAASRAGLLDAMGHSDPLFRDALESVLERGDFIETLPDGGPGGPPSSPLPAVERLAANETDPAIVRELIAHNQASVAALRREIESKSGSELFDFILEDIQELRRILFDPRSHQVFMTAMDATRWLNGQLQEWLGEKNAADTLTQSVHNNVTSEMGLALLDVADVIRPHAGVVAFLQQVEAEGFLDRLPALAGGSESQTAILAFLDQYGMRCTGEIDITRPRWAERPTTLVPMILTNIDSFGPGESQRRFEQGRQQSRVKEAEILERLQRLDDGEHKAVQVKQKIDQVRTFIGYREYPKYGMVSRYFAYKQALMREAERLVRTKVLREQDDIFYLSFQELQAVVCAGQVDGQTIERRKDAFRAYQALTPPRVLTSEGEAINGSYHQGDLPAGALVGLPVSGGTVEGRARVILDIAHARIEPGDILVTTYTDPSWTPAFVTIKGLVTEVGGLMTHGAVVAREYGLPAVVGVENATRLIQDGQQIRIHGTDGYIELLA